MDTYFAITSAIKYIALAIAFIAGLLTLYLVVKGSQMLKKEKHDILNPKSFEQKTEVEEVSIHHDVWTNIKQFSQSFTPSEWKLAVIEADKLVDDVLKSQGYIGESMGERLMGIDPSRFLTLQEVWDAHKLRNVLVHDMNQVISKDQAVRAVESYERFLQELGFFV